MITYLIVLMLNSTELVQLLEIGAKLHAVCNLEVINLLKSILKCKQFMRYRG